MKINSYSLLIFLFFLAKTNAQITKIESTNLAKWDLHGIGSVEFNDSEKAVKLTESKGSLGAMLVSPKKYSENVVVSLKVKPLQHKGVCVILLGLNDLDGGKVTIPETYNGNFNFWKSKKSSARSYAFGFHTNFHQPNAFIKENPGFINVAMKKDIATEEKWYDVEVGKMNNRFWMKIDNQMVIDTTGTISTKIFDGSQLALRVRGPGDGTFECLYKDLVIKENFNYKLQYSCDFNEKKDLDDWVLEGPGIAKIKNQKLFLSSKYQKFLHKKWKKNKIIINSTSSNYYPVLKEKMEKDLKTDLSDYTFEGAFGGGPIVLWNKIKTNGNYQINYDFKSLSPHSLHMMIFSALGTNGEDIFSQNLAKRNGTAYQYTRNDVANYRISYFAPYRKTANLRKSPGRQMLASGKDLVSQNPNKKHKLSIIKWNNNIQFIVDGNVIVNYEDDEAPLNEGFFGFRLMVPAIGLYDNIEVYELRKTAF